MSNDEAGSASPTAYQELAAVLRERLVVIGDREHYARDPEGHLERLKQVSAHIVSARASLPRPIDPQLEHFLDRASYDKALAFVENAHSV